MKVYTSKELAKIQKGALLFVSDDELKPGAKGNGVITYQEGSKYTGPLVFLGSSFEKLGYGTQDFTDSRINNDGVGGPDGDTLYLYQGEFDYRVSQWIYGNGIFYFLKDGKPDAYFPGFFSSTSYIKPYEGDNIEELLLPSFKNARRLSALRPNKARIAKMSLDKSPVDILFVGDSYFDFLSNHFDNDGKNLFEHYTKGMNAANIGIGGYRFRNWIPLVETLIAPRNPQKIVVNLGFNDLHIGLSADDTLKDAKEFVFKVLEKLPNARIYLLNVSHFPAFVRLRKKEDEYNRKLEEWVKTDRRLSLIDGASAFPPVEELKPYSEDDLVHPNNLGYSLWMPFIMNAVQK